MLVQRGRLTMDLESPEFRAWLRHLTVFPISLEIARQSTQLDFSSDPADEIIAATSVVENIPLLRATAESENPVWFLWRSRAAPDRIYLELQISNRNLGQIKPAITHDRSCNGVITRFC